MKAWQRWAKRTLDAVVASALLVVLFPLMAGIALAILITLGRPILFVQVRPGLNAHPFRLVKFRTMRTVDESSPGVADDARRLTRFGRMLRATSLDELPELVNVLRGDMSLVGPRPLLVEYLPLYSERQARRHDVRPGMTGWAQVNGRNATQWKDRLELDVWYVENQSLRLDFKILAATVAVTLRRQGIEHQGHATMPKFTGAAGAAEPCIDVSGVGESDATGRTTCHTEALSDNDEA